MQLKQRKNVFNRIDFINKRIEGKLILRKQRIQDDLTNKRNYLESDNTIQENSYYIATKISKMRN